MQLVRNELPKNCHYCYPTVEMKKTHIPAHVQLTPLPSVTMVTTGNTRPVIVFVNIKQNFFPVLLCA